MDQEDARGRWLYRWTQAPEGTATHSSLESEKEEQDSASLCSSISLSLLFPSVTFSFPWSSDAPCCWLLAGRTTYLPGCYTFLVGFYCLPVICAHHPISHPFIFLMLSWWPALFSQRSSVSLEAYPSSHIFVSTSFCPSLPSLNVFLIVLLCFTLYLSLNLWHPSSCILIYFTGSVSVTHPHSLIGGVFSFTEKHITVLTVQRKHNQEAASSTKCTGWLVVYTESFLTEIKLFAGF